MEIKINRGREGRRVGAHFCSFEKLVIVKRVFQKQFCFFAIKEILLVGVRRQLWRGKGREKERLEKQELKNRRIKVRISGFVSKVNNIII